MTQSQQITDGQTYTSGYQYNFSGALVKETYPSLREVNNEFEADGDLSRIYGKANPNAIERTYANGFSYTADGKIQRLKLGNNRWESAKFNDRLQVTELALGTSDGDGSLWKLGYEYGELENGTVNTAKNTGNIAKQTITFNGLTNPLVQTFKYDSLYRLTEARETNGTGTSAPQTWKENFSYDRYGNRTGLEKYVGTTQIVNDNKTHPTINPNTNRFNDGQGIYYDKNGNIIQDVGDQDAVRTFVFNGDNKQRFVVQAGKNVGEYFYDGEGQRVKKVVYNTDGVTIKEETIFVYSAGKLVEEYSTKTPPTNPTTSYTATDQLGSPRVITDSNGNVVSRRDFMPFGEEITNNIGERAAESLKYSVADGVRQKFTGYQKDEETNLDFAEARMYENRHGRFTAVDPLLASGKSANPQTFNRFVYVMNNPLAYTDPEGLQAGNYAGDVYTDGISYRRKPFEGSGTDPFKGEKIIDAEDGYSYLVKTGGWTQLGTTTEYRAEMKKIVDEIRGLSLADTNFYVGMGLSTVENSMNFAQSNSLNFSTFTINNTSSNLNFIPTTRDGQWFSPTYNKWYNNNFYGSGSVPSQYKTLALSSASNAANSASYAGSNVTRSYQLLQNSASARNLSFAKGLGRTSFVLGAGISVDQAVRGEISPLRAVTDTGAGYCATFLGPVGMAFAGAYFIGTKGFIDGPDFPRGTRVVNTNMCHTTTNYPTRFGFRK